MFHCSANRWRHQRVTSGTAKFVACTRTCYIPYVCVYIPAYLYYLLYRVSAGCSLFASHFSSIATGSHHNLCCNALSCLSLWIPRWSSSALLHLCSLLCPFICLFVCFLFLGCLCAPVVEQAAQLRAALWFLLLDFLGQHTNTHSHTPWHTLTQFKMFVFKRY